MEHIRQRFAEFNELSYFSRVDPEHPLDLFVGLDDQGRKAIKLRAKFTPKVIKGTFAIEVNQYRNNDFNTIQFSLSDDEISGLFYKFCDDLIESSRGLEDNSLGYMTITNRFFQWKKMFLNPKNEFLTEPEIIGLIGEILFLKTYLFDQYGQHKALMSWSGQELTHKDFSSQDIWYEVKAIYRSSQTVKISSIEQLDSDKTGELVVYSLEKMSPAFNGINLNKLVFEVYQAFDSEDDKSTFFAKVALQGFVYNDYYDNFVYEVNSRMRFLVDETFPKLYRANLNVAICKVQYELSLVDIKGFEINRN